MVVPLWLQHLERKPLGLDSVGKDQFSVEFVRLSWRVKALQEMMVTSDGHHCMLFQTYVAFDGHGRGKTFRMPDMRRRKRSPSAVSTISRTPCASLPLTWKGAGA